MATKKQRTTPQYELRYWPGIPGRGEFIRLVFEATGTPYTDVANDKEDGIQSVLASVAADATRDADGNPPAFAPPVLFVPGAGADGKALLLHQTPVILAYLGQQLAFAGGAGAGPGASWHAGQIANTALDLANETHNTHHPVDVTLYYEDQKEDSLKYSKQFRETRVPKFLSYFERALKGNEDKGKGQYFVGDGLTYADTTVWQALDGLKFAFPKEMAAREKEFPLLLGTFYPKFKDEVGIKDYLNSDRRLKYSHGVWRLYPELDRQ